MTLLPGQGAGPADVPRGHEPAARLAADAGAAQDQQRGRGAARGQAGSDRYMVLSAPSFFLFFSFIELQGTHMGSIYQPPPPFQADKVYTICQGLMP
jgi:hypothetical protein